MSDATQNVPAANEVPLSEAPNVASDSSEYKALKAEESAAEQAVDVRDQKFRVAAQLPGIILLDLGLASDPSATQGEQLRAMRQFLHAAIHPEDVGIFEHFLRTAQPVIEMEELNVVVEKLITMVAGRPTESPSA